jgi:hypothetical protein
MEEYTYNERKILRKYIWFIFAAGTVMVLTMLGLLLHDLISSHHNSDITSFLIVLAAGFLWVCIFAYFLANSPASLVVSDRVMRVNWSSTKKREYLWRDVSLKATGPQEFVLILIHDPVWLIPRWVLLDGSRRQYKELISRIKEVKHLVEIEPL